MGGCLRKGYAGNEQVLLQISPYWPWFPLIPSKHLPWPQRALSSCTSPAQGRMGGLSGPCSAAAGVPQRPGIEEEVPVRKYTAKTQIWLHSILGTHINMAGSLKVGLPISAHIHKVYIKKKNPNHETDVILAKRLF